MAKEKQLTKGQKQIFEENAATIKFYLMMTAIASLVHFVIAYLVFYETTSTSSWVFYGFSLFSQLVALQFMRSMAKAIRSETGQLLDAGIDLNMEGGFGEYCKDVIILSSIVQLLSTISAWFWIGYLSIPLFAVYKLWSSIIAPWVFAPSPDDGEDADGKGKRAKREQRRKGRW